MRKLIPFMALMKEVYFILDIHLTNLEVFSKVFKDNQSFIVVVESTKFSPRTKHIAIKYCHFRSLKKRRLFGSVILIHKNRQRTFSLSYPTKHYSCIHEENDLYGDLKVKSLLRHEGVLEYKLTADLT